RSDEGQGPTRHLAMGRNELGSALPVSSSRFERLPNLKPRLCLRILTREGRRGTSELRGDDLRRSVRRDAGHSGKAAADVLAWAQDDTLAREPIVKFYDALTAEGHKPEAHIFSAGGHGFGLKKQGTSSDHWIDAFFGWLEAQGFGS
ncbi:MAG: hypothetical protein ABUL63_00120, partial [Acidobacteriota bacterium]